MTGISIIIPSFNEEKRLSGSLKKILNYLSSKEYEWEIIVVDDGSSDRTSEIAKEVVKSNLKIIKNPTNRGKGYSVKKGVMASKGEIILFSDADLSTPIEEFDKMISWLKTDYDIVIGSRAIKESKIEIRQPWYREGMGKIFNLLVRIFILKRFKDTQCGFKCFKKEAAMSIFNNQLINGFSFDVEILLIAKKLGLKIKEVPVKWINSPTSRVGIVSGSLSMILELVRIKFYDWKGIYRK